MAEIARTVGRYELLDVLGRGGAGIVHRARQTDLGRLVALKELVDLHGDPEIVKRFLREARFGGALTHPNIVPVYEYLEHEGNAYIAMELLPHGSLRAYIGHLDLAQVGGVMEGILAALTYASQRLVHRDIKPENVLVGADGRVKLADFGIARAIDVIDEDTRLTSLDAIIGSPAYMAPEQASGGEIGPWTDLYSAGVVAYELLVGDRPFPRASSPAEALARLFAARIRPPLELRPTLDPGLAAWLERALERDPAGRHPSAAEAWDALEDQLIRLLGERWRRGSAIDVGPPPPAADPASRAAPAAVLAAARAAPATVLAAAPGVPPDAPVQRESETTASPVQPGTRRLVAFAAPFAILAAVLAAVVAAIVGH